MSSTLPKCPLVAMWIHFGYEQGRIQNFRMGGERVRGHSDRVEGKYVEYSTYKVPVVSNCILTATRIHTIDILDLYMN